MFIVGLAPVTRTNLAEQFISSATLATTPIGNDNRHRDVAFIRVNRPFEGNLRVFSYKATPKIGDEMIGVVDYPPSRAPVIRKNAKQVAIITYVYSSGGKNQPGIIGKLRNDYDALLSAFA
ncbi:hypothetical protein F4815DRAFT_443143 [Daldinia loculata]|nr:hypothetical protein F4815DRAFT_443143 [Daldinia loculata]